MTGSGPAVEQLRRPDSDFLTHAKTVVPNCPPQRGVGYAAPGNGVGACGRSESISSPVRTPCSDRMAALTTALTHVQFSGLARIC